MNIQPWQLKILDQMQQMKPGTEVKLLMSGRNVGKSMFSAAALKRLMDDIQRRPIEDLILAETRVHGSRYYTIEPVGGNWKDMEAWARNTYGEPGEVWDIKDSDPYGWPELARWYMNSRRFWFRDERDRDWFILKWR